MLYRVLRGIATIALRWYYRSIEVVGLEQFPSAGPVIVAANHWNALVDALLIACALDRPIRLTAKATLLSHPVTRLLIRAVGIIPLRRASDERQAASAAAGSSAAVDTAPEGATPSGDRNAQSFGAFLDALQQCEAVLIFPEGKSHSEPELARLKTGCARLALMAQVERGMPPVPIVPIGLTFEAKARPRSRVLVQIGPPLRTELHAAGVHDEGALELTPERVQALTTQLDRALRDITLNFASTDDAERVLQVSAVLTTVLDRVRPLAAPDPPLSTAFRMAQRLEAARQVLPDASSETLGDVQAFLERLEALRTRLGDLRIPVNDISMPVTLTSGAWFVLREAAITVATLPIAAWGRLHHWIPLWLARRIGRATSTGADEPAMRTLVAGLVTVFVSYAAVAAAMVWGVGPWWAVAYVLTLPPAAFVDFWLAARLRRAAERARAYLTLRADPERRAELRREAGALRDTARRLDELVR